MKPLARLFAIATGLALMLHSTPSWGQPVCASPGCNPTTSDASNNTAGGTSSLGSLSAGTENTAFGRSALVSNTTGTGNTASGANALAENTTGIGNTASGNAALRRNTAGIANTASGQAALFFNTTGRMNTAVGQAALRQSTGSNNIAIGFNAGATLTNGNYNIYLENFGGGDESQTMRLGGIQTRTFIAGIVTANVNGATVEIDANGQLGIKNSSARYKQDIAPMGSRSEKVLDLRPVTFAYKDDTQAVTHYGLIAEEVASVYPDLVTRTASGEVQTVKYQELIPMLLNELQRQRQDLAKLQALVEQGRGVEASTCAAAGETAASTQ